MNVKDNSVEDEPFRLHGEIPLRKGTPDYEYLDALKCLEQGLELAQGLRQLAELLAFEPQNYLWLDLLDRYLASQSQSPEALLENEGDSIYFATEAIRSYIWHRQGRLSEAVDLLLTIASFLPACSYLEGWATGWLEAEGAVESLDEDLAWQLFATVLNRAPEFSFATVGDLETAGRWSDLCQRYLKVRGGSQRDYSLMICAGLMRKSGLLVDAEKLVRARNVQSADWQSRTALGLILREKGDLNAAEASFREAIQLEPGDLSARLEAGDMFVNQENFEKALLWYEDALALKSTDEWAIPSSLYCHWKLSKNKRALAELIEFSRSGNPRAKQLYNREFGGLPEPADGTAAILRQLRNEIIKYPEDAPRGSISLSLGALEAPSNYLAFELEMKALKHNLELQVTVDEIPYPDPREPVCPVKYKLWNYDKTVASPAYRQPAKELKELIAKLASERFDEALNWANASKAAAELGAFKIEELLAVMTYPPDIPEGLNSLVWLPRVQLTVMQMAAQIDSGWHGSQRKDALLSVLFGPRDWSTNAAIRVLAYLAGREPVYSAYIGAAFRELSAQRQRRAYSCWEHTLYNSWMGLPHLLETEKEELESLLFQIERS